MNTKTIWLLALIVILIPTMTIAVMNHLDMPPLPVNVVLKEHRLTTQTQLVTKCDMYRSLEELYLHALQNADTTNPSAEQLKTLNIRHAITHMLIHKECSRQLLEIRT